MPFRFATHSEIGLVRKNNQDSGYASPRMLVVADGMGGAAAGDLASAATIDRVRRLDTEDLASDDTPARLVGIITQANERLADLVADDVALEGMGTTCTAVVLDDDRYVIGHIGDSRAYLLRDGELVRLTHDHSWVQSLVDDGRLTEEEAAEHPHRSLLLRVLNGQPNNEPDLLEIDAQPGDRLLVCSDGLCGLVDDDTMSSRLTGTHLEAIVADLVDDAHAAGGSDNITIILADITDSTDDDAPVILGAAAALDLPARHARPANSLDGDDAPSAVAQRPRRAAEDERYALREAPPTGRRLAKTSLIVALVLAVLVGAGFGGYSWAMAQYYVAPHDGKVAIFQGLNESAFGYRLNKLVEVTETPLSDLPGIRRGLVNEGIPVANLDGAHRTASELASDAQRCRAIRAKRTTPPAIPVPTPPATPQATAPGSVATPGSTTGATATPTPAPAEDDC